MTRLAWSMVFALVGSCSSSRPALDRATIGLLDYGVPSGWSSRELSTPQRVMVEWRPDPDDNEHKESLAILRTDRRAVAKSPPHLKTLLEDAQQALPGSKFDRSIGFTTRHGFRGVRVEGELVSHGTQYRRIHAVLVDGDGDSLVHVLYTARELDRERFEAVVDSFAKKGG
ncbi:MAG: hypothetical protein H0V17_00780 [Deltaproteobacteria bacterium]|nr:hypothetical protein [Deltaproteobacteria bacterium]